MPLTKGYSKKTVSSNIQHCLSNFKKTGKVSGHAVGSMKQAMKECAGMAYSSAKESISSDKPSMSKELAKHG